MPVQINEVVVRTVVQTTPSVGTPEPDCPPGSGGADTVAEIVEKVLEILREKQER